MRKFLLITGAIALVGGVCIAILASILVVKGRKLDRQSKRYADRTIVAIVSNWNENALVERASPEFKRVCPAACADSMFNKLDRLGHLKRYLGSKGAANIRYWSGQGMIITASYIARATFANGTASIKLNLVKRKGEWSVVRFFVHVDNFSLRSSPA